MCEQNTNWIEAGKVADIEASGRTVFRDPAIGDVLIVRAEGQLYALSAWCSHASEALDAAEVEGCEIICPLHGARFDLESGRALTPPAIKALRTWPVRTRDGTVEIGLDAHA